VRFHHHPGDCYFSRALQMLFYCLHIQVVIDYVGAERTHPHYPEEWIVSAHILRPHHEHGGTVESAVHYALSPRATFVARISDAASQALSVLCHFAGEELDHTVWRHFPRRAPGEMRSAIMGVQNMLNTRMVAQVGLTAALHTHMERNAEELQRTHRQLADERRKNEVLQAQLQGRDPPAQEDVVDVAVSPPCKRTNFGPQHPTTTVLP